MKYVHHVRQARELLNKGGILAYPTEAVYGLGCCPFQEQAVKKILAMKQRPESKGLIVLIADWSQLAPWIGAVSQPQMTRVQSTWPGPVTWVFPKAASVPIWLSGEHDGIAIRMSAHPLVRELCAEGPVVSTSANKNGWKPAMDAASLCEQFSHGIDGILEGVLGGAPEVSSIYRVVDGQRLR
jgi:L-threonylcarbamoyladenylate synthase